MKFITVILCGLLSTYSISQEKKIEIKKTDKEFFLDGFLNDDIWKDATQFSFSEFNPNWGKKDSLTKMYVTFDDTYLYVGLDAKDPNPEKIINRNLIRDGWYGDDFFSFHIDPNLTKTSSLVFSIYPSGSRYDMSISNDGVPLGNSTFNPSYDMIWQGKTQITKLGWSAELKIPISNLRFKLDKEGVAAISAIRTQNYLNRTVATPLTPQNIPNANQTPSLKQAVLFQGLIPKKQLQITPYILGSLGNTYELNENEYQRKNINDFEAGLDVRFGITPKLTLDATLNTDFAQVEIDNQIVNLNRGSIFLPEKRKFFQEQAGLFDFSTGVLSQIFYSRKIGINNGQIVPILGGLRLTGQIGNADIGLLSLQTEGTTSNDGTFLPSENFSVLRLRKKIFNDRSFIGFISTNRLNKDRFSSVYGIDGVISLPNEHFIMSSIATSIEKTDIDHNLLDNSRIAFLFEKRKEDGLFYSASYEYSAENFNPSMGFLLRENHQNFYAVLRHGKFKSDKSQGLFRYNRWTFLGSDIYFTTDLSRVLTYYNRSSWKGAFFSGDEISAFGQAQYEYLPEPLSLTNNITIPTGSYFFNFYGLSYTSGVKRKIQLPLSLEYGSFYGGENYHFSVSPEINIGQNLNLSTSWSSNYLNFKKRNQDEWINVIRTKLNWAYNLHLSGSLIGQYNSTNNKFLTSARLRYNFKDGHDLYMVYNQSYNLDLSLSSPRLPKYDNQIFALKYAYSFSK